MTGRKLESEARRRARGVWLAALAVAAAGAQPPGLAAPVSVDDDLQRRVTLAEPARRVVSLAPHLTELMFAIDAGALLVGADLYSDYPPPARQIPRVGGAGHFDLERILALKPDLVLAWDSGNPAAQLQRIESLGLLVYRSEPRRLPDIAVSLRRLGRLTGRDAAAEARATEFERRLARLRAEVPPGPRVKVFYQVWDDPLITLSGEHLVSQVIALCGGRNLFDGLPTLAGQVDREAVIAGNPDVIIASGIAGERPLWLDRWRAWPSLAAVREQRLYALHPDLLQRHTPRLLQGLARVCEWLGAARRGAQSGRK